MLINNKTELNVKDISHHLQWNTHIKYRDVERRYKSIESFRKLERFNDMYNEIHHILGCCEKFFEAYILLENFRNYCGLKKPILKIEERKEWVQNLYKHYSEMVAES